MGIVFDYIKNLSIFELVFDLVIVILAGNIRMNLAKVGKALQEISKKVDKAYKDTTGKFKKNLKGNLERTSIEEIEREDYEPLRSDFNKQLIEYNSFVNLISVLPLMGLLGTIMGLIPGLIWVKSGDFEHLYGSLSTALTSTFVGLVGSIYLKWYVSMKVGKIINRIEIIFAEIDRLYVIQ